MRKIYYYETDLQNIKVAFYVLMLAIVITLISVFIISPELNDSGSDCVPGNYTNDIFNTDAIYTHKIILFGDSLIEKPTNLYGMPTSILNRLQSKYPTLSFEMISSGIGGNSISELRARLCPDVISRQPEAVIMYWDSDISDSSVDYSLSDEGINAYKRNLNYVIESLIHRVRFLAIAGPELIGELPYGQNPKDKCLNLYQDINRNISLSYNITYIDIRQQFLDEDKYKGWDQYSGYLTIDGEHPSLIGSKIEENLFTQQLIKWYQNVKK